MSGKAKQTFSVLVLLFVLGSMVVPFQNCSQPYDLGMNEIPMQSLGGSQVILINEGAQYTRETEVRVIPTGQAAMLTSIYLTDVAGCASGGTWAQNGDIFKWVLQGKDGEQTLYAKFRKNTGEESECYSASIILDREPPTIDFQNKPAAITGNRYADFTIDARDLLSDIKGLECRLNSNEFTRCEYQLRVEDVNLGDNSFEVRATDGAGNVSQVARFEWSIDTSQPSVTLTPNIAALTNKTAASFSFAADDGTGGSGIAAIYCQLDNAAAAPCQSPVSLANLSSGYHTFKVYAVDNAKFQSAPLEFRWMVDTVAPTVTFVRKPDAITTVASQVFQFDGDDAASGIASYLCQYDNETRAACTSGRTIATTDGSHTFRVWAVDKAGNQSAPAVATFITDINAPTLALSRRAEGVVVVRTATFAWTVSDGQGSGIASVTCQLDSGTPAACSNQWNGTDITSGTHRLTIRVTDYAARVSTFTYDWRTNTRLTLKIGNYYVSAENGGGIGRSVTVDKTSVGAGENFGITPLSGTDGLRSGHRIHMRTTNGPYLAVICGGAGTSRTDCGVLYGGTEGLGGWETFTIEKVGAAAGDLIQPGDVIAVRSFNGSYCEAAGGGGGGAASFTCVRTSLSNYGRFTIGFMN